MKKKGNTSLTSPKILWSICLVLIFLMTGNAMGKVNGSHVQMDTALSQTKVLRGDSGNISLALTLVGAEAEEMVNSTVQPVDLVVVLDRSGSMGGQKINFARNAIIQLINFMGRDDRLALITYSNSVEVLSPLVHLHGGQRQYLRSLVRQVMAGGGTNLGSGLQMGINTLMDHANANRQRRVVLISDGLANQGITSPRDLGEMAARATEWGMGVSTVGVGYDFNELLMTTIADHGAGNYYFMENPHAFARIFKKEFETTRQVVAGNAELRIQLRDGVQLIDAGGYPIKMVGNIAIIKLGDLLAGQQRKLFLSYRVATAKIGSYQLGELEMSYRNGANTYQVMSDQIYQVDCIEDEKRVISSIDKEVWSEQVVKDDFNKLKNKVADAVRKGEKKEALEAIADYETRTGSLNDKVGSAEVSKNLQEDLAPLKQSVEQTFVGAPSAVAEKRKQQAKELQYESYKVRRDKK